ncbi:MAG: hypothetical protein E4H07_04395 [Nitrosomonadales bacterium]|jgi:hypothetical protein|nr:MAG: hypothetical protein E4H07_04395 [Nitrosomonadales bacterium]
MVKLQYWLRGKMDKEGVMPEVTGYSRAQIKRLIKQYHQPNFVSVKMACRNSFKPLYTNANTHVGGNG